MENLVENIIKELTELESGNYETAKGAVKKKR